MPGSLLVLAQLTRENEDQKCGIEIAPKALRAPLQAMTAKAGEDGAVIAGRVLDTGDCKFGFDAQSGGLMDLATAGVIGPRGPADSGSVAAVPPYSGRNVDRRR